MVDVNFVGQLVDSIGDAVSKLEVAISDKKIDEANGLKTFIFDLHMQLSKATEGVENV